MIPTTIEHSVLIDPIMYRAGFKDGTRSRLRGSLSDNESYLAGFNCGIRLYQSSIPDSIKEGYLETGAHDEPLNPLDSSRPPMV